MIDPEGDEVNTPYAGSAINVEEVLRRAHKAFQGIERSNSVATWELLAEFIAPSQSGRFLSTGGLGSTPGQRKTLRLHDSTAVQAARDLAAAVHGTLTNPATQWSRIRFRDEKLNNDKLAMQWLEDTTTRIHQQLNDSNFDMEVSKAYLSFVVFGSMALMQEEDGNEQDGPYTGLLFKSFHLSECAWLENKNGLVDTFFRKFKLTAKQAAEKFDLDVLPQKIKDSLITKPEDEFTFVHCIYPRDASAVKLNSIGLAPGPNRNFASIYIYEAEKLLMLEDGYYEFPVRVVRWDTMPSEVYGNGPGHVALPDIRSLNTLKELNLRSIAKAVDPPLMIKDRGVLGSLNLSARSVTVVRDMESIKPLTTTSRFDVTKEEVMALQQDIKQMFYLDKLMLPPRTDTGEQTAFEISQRIEQMQKVLGPTLGRLNAEFLTPLIVRNFKIMLRSNQLAPMPPVLTAAGVNVDIEFVNQLARSQKMEDVSNIQAFVQQLALLGKLQPEVLDVLDTDAAAYHIARVTAVPEEILKDEAAIQQVRAQRAKQMKAQQALQAGVQIGDMSTKLAQAGSQASGLQNTLPGGQQQ